MPETFRKHDYAAMVSRVTEPLARPPEVFVVRGAPSAPGAYQDLLSSEPGDAALPALDPDAVRMVLYTSGTTGRPKGVLHSHNSMHALMCQFRKHWLIEKGDKLLVPSPIGHITGSMCAVESPLLFEACALLMDRWNAEDAVKLMDGEGCTHIIGATPFLDQLLAASRQAGSTLPTLKLFACGGASVPPSLIHDAAAYFERAVVTYS